MNDLGSSISLQKILKHVQLSQSVLTNMYSCHSQYSQTCTVVTINTHQYVCCPKHVHSSNMEKLFFVTDINYFDKYSNHSVKDTPLRQLIHNFTFNKSSLYNFCPPNESFRRSKIQRILLHVKISAKHISVKNK